MPQRPSLRSRIKGMLIGGAIGDALGGPVETWTPEKIYSVHPNGVRGYVEPIGHKWFTPETLPPGSITDDTQLTWATMNGFIDGSEAYNVSKNFDCYLDGIALHHQQELEKAIGGWGKSTVEAVRRMINGVHWSKAGKTDQPRRGTGNGVAMKISPLAAWACTKQGLHHDFSQRSFNQIMVDYAAMTHWTKMAAISGIIHCNSVWYCLKADSRFDVKFMERFLNLLRFLPETENSTAAPLRYDISMLDDTDDNLWDRMKLVLDNIDSLQDMSLDQLREMFGNGSCYVYDSLPFTYAWFFRGYDSFETILAVAEAGGDTDSNAKMVGELIGALHGMELFEQPANRWALDGLKCRDELLGLAELFCDLFVPQDEDG